MTTYIGNDGKRTKMGVETHGKDCYHVDATNPDFRKYAWSLIESGYVNQFIDFHQESALRTLMDALGGRSECPINVLSGRRPAAF